MTKLEKSAVKEFQEMIFSGNFEERISAIQNCKVLSYMVEKNIKRGAK